MTYDLYFHNDFDGIASAAVLLSFFESHGDRVKNFVPLNFDVKPTWASRTFARPAALLDFPYHPRATWWFDHHDDPFMLPAWKREFRPSPERQYKSNYPSCCGMVLDHLENTFGFKPPRHIRALAKRLDVIDSAAYPSARAAQDMRVPSQQIHYFIEEKMQGPDPEWIVRLLSKVSLREVAAHPRIRAGVKKINAELRRTRTLYREHIERYGAVGVLDLRGVAGRRVFLPYVLYPKLKYVLFVKPLAKGMIDISFGANPWVRHPKDIAIGVFMKREFGGGGHPMVGGAEFTDEQSFARAKARIIKKFS